jgi:succinate dehydrogenase / fumarate reductase cytochrome b subunit
MLRPGSWLRRLHSLSGVVPVGAFLAFHLYVNSSAARGADAYNATVRRLQQLPLSVFAEIACIFLPLAFHGVSGLFLTATVPVSVERPTRAGRFLAILQRVTGVLLFGFILFHLWTARLVQLEDHESLDLFHLMQSALASPWIHALYLGGILAATSHLASGLWSFSETWGLARTPRARAAVAVVAAGVFVLLSVMGVQLLAAFRLPTRYNPALLLP